MDSFVYYRILGYVATILIHSINTVVMMASFKGEPMQDPVVRHFKDLQCYFFTCWTFVFQITYSLYGIFCESLIIKNKENKKYKLPAIFVKIKDLYFTAVVWPSTLMVLTVFWTFFWFDRNLLYPESIDKVITNTSNHTMHTLIVLFILWEGTFNHITKPKNHVLRIIFIWAVEVFYIVTLILVHEHYGAWVYPIFGKLNGNIYFPVFFIAIAILLFVLYHIQWKVYTLLWQERYNTSQKIKL